MVQEYQSYPILDFKGGLTKDKEPWLIAEDAFSVLTNAILYRGKLIKRRGFREFAVFVNKVTGESVTDVINPSTGTLANFPIRDTVSSAIFTDSAGTPQVMTYDGDGAFTGDGTGTLDVATGVYSLTWDAGPTGPITVDYSYEPQNPIMGIENYYTNAGVSDLIIFDTKRACVYNSTTFEFDAIGTADIWSGNDANFFWVENYKERLFVTNNSNRLKSYNGTAFSDVLVEFDTTSSGNELDTCLMVFVYKERLVLLRPTENGTSYPQRARWSAVNNPDNYTLDEFIDAPTVDFIVAADFLGDDLIVWFETSIWALKFTQSSVLPFRWEKIVDTDGSSATFALNTFSNEQVGIGPTSIISTDGIDAVDINQKIPDAVLSFDSNGFKYIYSVLIEELQLILISYPSIGSSLNDKSLALNFENNTWADFSLGFHTYGFFAEQQDYTWENIGLAWDDIEFAWDDKSLQAGYPLTIAGNDTGTVFQLNTTGSDDGESIPVDIRTKKFNPYVAQGFKARLGWVEFLLTTDLNVVLTVEFYINHITTPYLTKTIDAIGDGQKTWKRINVGAIGEFHSMRIYHDATNQTFEIHDINLYFKPIKGRFKLG